MLHEDRTRAEIAERVQALRPDSRRRWGRMSVDQALWHMNQAMLVSLGQLQTRPTPMAFRFVAKPFALNMPWPKGVRTAPEFVAVSPHDFASERKRCVQMLEDFAHRPLDGSWPSHPLLGRMTGRDWSRMHHRHFEHHLRQFGG